MVCGHLARSYAGLGTQRLGGVRRAVARPETDAVSKPLTPAALNPMQQTACKLNFRVNTYLLLNTYDLIYLGAVSDRPEAVLGKVKTVKHNE